MTREEAREHLLAGGYITHPMIKGKTLAMLGDRIVVVQNGFRYGHAFNTNEEYAQGWEKVEGR